MGELFEKQVRERYLDLVDWIDIRPDFNLYWSFGIVAIIGAMFAVLPNSMMIAAVMIGTMAAVGLLAIGVVAALVWVVCRASIDALLAYRQHLPDNPKVEMMPSRFIHLGSLRPKL